MTTTSSQPLGPTFCQWEIWQVVWEHEDGTSKNRPALILSSTASASAGAEIWVAKFTKTRADVPFRMEFARSDPSFAATGLSDSCYLYISQARKIPKVAFLYRRGRLPVLSAIMVGIMVKQALKLNVP